MFRYEAAGPGPVGLPELLQGTPWLPGQSPGFARAGATSAEVRWTLKYLNELSYPEKASGPKKPVGRASLVGRRPDVAENHSQHDLRKPSPTGASERGWYPFHSWFLLLRRTGLQDLLDHLGQSGLGLPKGLVLGLHVWPIGRPVAKGLMELDGLLVDRLLPEPKEF